MPKKIDELVERIKKNNPSYSDAQAYATAWSVYCKHVDPGSDHCKRKPEEYLKGASLRRRAVRIAHENANLRAPILRAIKAADPWSKLPKGWTQESVDKFWGTLTGDVKHKVTKCMEQMKGKVDDTGAFCGSLADKVEGTTSWRGKEAFNVHRIDWDDPRLPREIADNVETAFLAMLRGQHAETEIPRLQKALRDAQEEASWAKEMLRESPIPIGVTSQGVDWVVYPDQHENPSALVAAIVKMQSRLKSMGGRVVYSESPFPTLKHLRSQSRMASRKKTAFRSEVFVYDNATDIEMLFNPFSDYLQVGMGGEWWNGPVKLGTNVLHHKKERVDPAYVPVTVRIEQNGHFLRFAVGGGFGGGATFHLNFK